MNNEAKRVFRERERERTNEREPSVMIVAFLRPRLTTSTIRDNSTNSRRVNVQVVSRHELSVAPLALVGLGGQRLGVQLPVELA